MTDKKKKIFTIKQINSFKKEIFALSQQIERNSLIVEPMLIAELLQLVDEDDLIIELADKKGRAIQLIKISDKIFGIDIPSMYLVYFFNTLDNAKRCLSQAICNSHALFMPFLTESEETENSESQFKKMTHKEMNTYRDDNFEMTNEEIEVFEKLTAPKKKAELSKLELAQQVKESK